MFVFSKNSLTYKIKAFLLVAAVVVIVNTLPFLLLGEDSHIIIHDNLDCEFSFLQVLKNHEALNPFRTVELNQIFNGLNSAYIATSGWLIRWLAGSFSIFSAYVVYSVFVRLVGFTGAWLLSKLLLGEHFEKNLGLVLLTCFVFASMGGYIIYGISLFGLPLAIWAILNLSHEKKSQRMAALVVLGAYPFLSHFAFSGVFIPGLVGLNMIYRVRNQLIFKSNLKGLAIVTICTVLAHWTMLHSFIFGELTQRIERQYFVHGFPFFSALQKSVKAFLFGQYHVGLICAPTLLVAAVIAVYINPKNNRRVLFYLVLTSICAFSLGFGNYISQTLEPILPFLNAFQFSRIYQFLPLCMLLIALDLIRKSMPFLFKLLVFGPFCLGTLWLNQEIRVNWEGVILGEVKEKSFREFFMKSAFSEAADDIGVSKDSYRVICLGIHPAVAQFNGFSTLDSYQNLYPLAYKHWWKEIIKDELVKNQELSDYFNFWGSRCYAFSAEIGMPSNHPNGDENTSEVQHWELDFHALHNAGCHYVFSSTAINLKNHPNLYFVNEFASGDSELKVYRIVYNEGV